MAIVVDLEIELTTHLLKRMEDRGFNESGLTPYARTRERSRPDIMAGRFVIEVRHAGQSWAVVVEPEGRQLLVVSQQKPI